jgi:hypothetical protein
VEDSLVADRAAIAAEDRVAMRSVVIAAHCVMCLY